MFFLTFNLSTVLNKNLKSCQILIFIPIIVTRRTNNDEVYSTPVVFYQCTDEPTGGLQININCDLNDPASCYDKLLIIIIYPEHGKISKAYHQISDPPHLES